MADIGQRDMRPDPDVGPPLSIYSMKLHEWMNFRHVCILRVAGGWIYQINHKTPAEPATEWSITTTFVPYSSEYLGHNKENLP